MLTREILLSVTKTEDLKSVHSLKLEGMELNSCFKLLLQDFGISLYLLSLKNNSLTEIDISLGFTNLRKLDLSTNFLVSIGSKDLWSSMPRLQVLYLHDNLLENWDTLESLSSLPSILHLTLFNNPCIHLLNYRKFMISSLPTLLALDFYISTEEEKNEIAPLDNEKTKVWIQDTSDLRNFRQHIYKLRRKWEQCSPVIKIQALWRRYKVRKHMGGHLTERDKKAVFIQKFVRTWLLRKRLKRDLEKLLRETNNEHLLYEPEEFVKFKAAKIIQEWYLVCKKKKLMAKRRNLAITKIASSYRRYKICKLNLPFVNRTRFYVLKSQQRTLICFLRALAVYAPEEYHPANSIIDRIAPEYFENMKKKTEGYSFSELYDRVKDSKNLKIIRFPDIDNIPYSGIPAVQNVKWVHHAKIVNSWYDRPIAGHSISLKYCTSKEYQILKRFKIRGCSLTKSEKGNLKEISYHFDDYLDFLEFNAPTLQFAHELYMNVLEFNKYLNGKDFPNFILIHEALVERVKAACTLQSFWRGHMVRRSCTLARMAIERRAAYSIQRWWRILKYIYRISSLSCLKQQISLINSPTLYLQEHLFQYLSPSIAQFRFIEQDFSFFCRFESIYLMNSPRENHKLLPSWLGVQLFVDRTGYTPSDEERTLQAAVLTGARVEIVSLSSQVSNLKVADPSLKFLKIEFSSVEEAKKRAAVVFLQTFDHKSKTFIELMTIECLRKQFLMSRLRSIWKARNINPNEPCPAMEILGKALSPIENSYQITPTPQPPPSTAPIIRPRPNTRFAEMPIYDDVTFDRRDLKSSEELLRKRVQRTREESLRRQTESKISKQMDLEIRMNEAKEAKEHVQEIMNFRCTLEQKQIELKKNFIKAQARKKQESLNERKFINQFAQARNMLQKLMKNSDMERWKHKSREDVRARVAKVKASSVGRINVEK